MVKKINLNSLYGALLNPGSRSPDERLGQSTTSTGRCIAKHMAYELNRVIAGEYDSTGKAIVYGDTDPPTLVRILTKGLRLIKVKYPGTKIQLLNIMTQLVKK